MSKLKDSELRPKFI